MARTYGDRTMSPNHEFRRAQIIDVASELVRARGVAACTVRRVAERAGVSKGVVHYYFSDAHGLVDLAFAQLATTYYDHVRSQFGETDPEQAFWNGVVSYVMPWDAHSSMPLLWCEYYVTSLRSGRVDGVVAIQQEMEKLFAEALARISPEAERHSAAVTRHVTGITLTQPQMPVEPAEFVAEIARLTGIPAPHDIPTMCTDPQCRFHRDSSNRSMPSASAAGGCRLRNS